MKKNFLFILFLFPFNLICSQSIEVVVTDTVMCKVESYKYLLSMIFRKDLDKRAFQKELISNNHSFEKTYEEEVIEEIRRFFKVEYTIVFKTDKERFDFELSLNLGKRNFVMTLMDMEIFYEEQDKRRLIKKLITRGEEKARLIASVLGKKLNEIINIKDALNFQGQEERPEDIARGNYNVRDMVESNSKDEGAKMKTLIITFETEK